MTEQSETSTMRAVILSHLQRAWERGWAAREVRSAGAGVGREEMRADFTNSIGRDAVGAIMKMISDAAPQIRFDDYGDLVATLDALLFEVAKRGAEDMQRSGPRYDIPRMREHLKGSLDRDRQRVINLVLDHIAPGGADDMRPFPTPSGMTRFLRCSLCQTLYEPTATISILTGESGVAWTRPRPIKKPRLCSHQFDIEQWDGAAWVPIGVLPDPRESER